MKNSQIKVFIVEDNVLYGAMLEEELKQKTEFDITVYTSGEAMIEVIQSGNKPNIIISDYNLEGTIKDALELVHELNKIVPSVPVVILTSIGDMNKAIQILKEGAFDLITKDDNAFPKIISILNNVAELLKLKDELINEKAKSKQDKNRLLLLTGIIISALILYSFFN
jgi:DNA-binding NtrC family response regulator